MPRAVTVRQTIDIYESETERKTFISLFNNLRARALVTIQLAVRFNYFIFLQNNRKSGVNCHRDNAIIKEVGGRQEKKTKFLPAPNRRGRQEKVFPSSKVERRNLLALCLSSKKKVE
jgi:hypothetical protein